MTRWILACCAIGALVACDDSNTGHYTGRMALQPDAAVIAQISPQTFFVGTPGVLVCTGGFFSPSFTLVVTPGRPLNTSISSATFTLIDGSTRGGPSVTFPQPQLTRMFGTTVLASTRTFPFTPGFQCPTVLPVAMTADVTLDDGQRLTATMAVGR
ncbi:MAG TPA: hypothetical protein VNG89_16885 [Vicinamibacterales bacterium]|nr:hypothetical protein [Vicinamibacterales bacterium]